MAELREERPYSQFNFKVSFDGTEPKGGFQEVSGLGMEVTVSEYRTGNASSNAPVKITNLYKVPDVTLKRGVIGATDLNDWLKQVRDGAQKEALKSVNVELIKEDRSGPAMRWELKNARPIKYTGPSLNGKGTDVAIEELVLACERIELETSE